MIRTKEEKLVRVTVALLLSIAPRLLAQQAAPRLLYIYRDSLRRGVDSAYRAIENEGARLCADYRCPNPYLGLESLSEPHEAWWLNAFAGPDDTARVGNAYAANRPLATALRVIAERKASLIGTPVQGYAVYRPALSRGPAWSVRGARFMIVTVTRRHRPGAGSAFEMADSTLYILQPVATRRRAVALAARQGGRVFAIRPNWSMPAPEWAASDPEFWRRAPRPAH